MEIKCKRLLLSVSVGLMISTNSMQASQHQNLSNTTELLELKGPVQTLHYNSDIYGSQILEFDASGYLTKGEFLYPDTSEATRKAMESEFPEHQRIYIYDKDKKLLEIQKEPINATENMSTGIKFEYSKSSTPHSSLEEGPNSRDVTRLFFEDGKLSKEVVVLMTKGDLLPEINTYSYQYDKDGLLKLSIKQTLDTRTKQEIFRDDKGFFKEVRFSWSDLHGNHQIKLLYNHLDFDKYGNWTKRLVSLSGNEKNETQTQTFTYYK